jgi:hypothetical protein
VFKYFQFIPFLLIAAIPNYEFVGDTFLQLSVLSIGNNNFRAMAPPLRKFVSCASDVVSRKDTIVHSKDSSELHPYYVTGFSDGEACFSISISTRYKNPQVRFSFRITQKDHSVEVLNKIYRFFHCGVFTSSQRDKTVEFVVTKFSDILLIIIPHFESYPLRGSKQLNFESFKEAAYLARDGAHLTEVGLSKIKYLKDRMNTKRSFEEKYRFCIKNSEQILHPQ